MLLGTNNIADIKLGNNQVESVYLGTNLVWQKPLLDKYPSAAAAFSLRRLRSAYTGSAIRVRRSSDNAEQDIGFIGQTLDVPSLLNFVGAGSGFVVTWYDQSGSGNNATQTTLANQPRIVNSGALETSGGMVSIFFDGSNDRLIANYPQLLDGNRSIFFVAQSLVSTLNYYFWIGNTTALRNGYGISPEVFLRCSSATVSLNSINGIGRFLFSTFYPGGVMSNNSFYRNGVFVPNGAVSNDGALNTQSGLVVGGFLTSNFYSGHLQELVFYNSNQLVNQALIEANINQFYGIY